MNVSPELWDILKLLAGGYFIYVLNKSDRNQSEIYKRLRKLELKCAGNHGVHGGDDEDP